MEFPDLTVSESEKRKYREINALLTNKLKSIFINHYEINPDIRCIGSTEKGTALPEKFGGADLDNAILSNEEILKLIAFKSNAFEGCQLFNLDILSKFINEFEKVYFAGHRISGFFQGVKFDFSITDISRDKWKIDFTIGSDAHSPDLLFANVGEVSQKLKELGITKVKYFKDSNRYSFNL